MGEQVTGDTNLIAKATTKEALLDAGLAIILEKGYHHTGIQEVLQAAGHLVHGRQTTRPIVAQVVQCSKNDAMLRRLSTAGASNPVLKPGDTPTSTQKCTRRRFKVQ